ncbi:unnamed protein product [Urochloa decumbens]|uniref:DUF4220 domain-containing protein n=1 Tax=Urochloa decumbens TaxID=240449 RepID=A0ABC8Z8W7_9POAL
MPYFNSNHTGLCETNEVIWRIGNLTASYAAGNGKEELMMVSAPVIVLILVALFLAGVFGFSAVLNPSYRLLLSSALALSLPVMSYLFSEAMDAAGGSGDDLSVRARMILTWMLSLELLRKKVDEIRARGSYYSSTLERAGRVVWLGSLIYFNITSPGGKAVFSILWILCATKLVQRIAFTEVEKRSYPDKSLIISSYMAQIMGLRKSEPEHDDVEHAQGGGEELLKRCEYIVMGEEKLVKKVTEDGYELNQVTPDDISIITVGKVWKDAVVTSDDQNLALSSHTINGVIRRVCLSFALFKLLRRRFEHLPELTEQEARDCRRLLMEGLYSSNDCRQSKEAEALLFQVMADEMKFLSEYYHSVVPVVLASPIFVLANYFIVPVVVLGLCLIALAACGNGDVSYALGRISADNNSLVQPGFAKIAICTIGRAAHSRPAFFFTLDLCITALLPIIFFLEEIWEFLVVLTSNWFMISLLCNHMSSNRYPLVIRRRISWLQRKMSKYTNIRLKQFSLLGHRGPVMSFMPATVLSSFKLRSVRATQELKRSIMDCLVRGAASPLSSRKSALERRVFSLVDDSGQRQFLAACMRGTSVTEMIITWHIATRLLHDTAPPAPGIQKEAEAAKVAITLSQYCAYLVVFHPELLPDRRAKAELVLENAKKELREILGFLAYYLASHRARIRRLRAHISRMKIIWETADTRSSDDDRIKVVLNGVKLGVFLGRHGDKTTAWKVLADVWTELIVYAAPARDEEHVNAHADILPEGVELITVLWAFAMHTGMKRPPRGAHHDSTTTATNEYIFRW